jgi:hypothetical protein
MMVYHLVIRDRFVTLGFRCLAPPTLEICTPAGLRVYAEHRKQLFQILALATRAQGRLRVANERLKKLSAVPALEVIKRHWQSPRYSRNPNTNMQWPAAIATYCLPSTW